MLNHVLVVLVAGCRFHLILWPYGTYHDKRIISFWDMNVDLLMDVAFNHRRLVLFRRLCFPD
jgi:hypothetical protein